MGPFGRHAISFRALCLLHAIWLRSSASGRLLAGLCSCSHSTSRWRPALSALGRRTGDHAPQDDLVHNNQPLAAQRCCNMPNWYGQQAGMFCATAASFSFARLSPLVPPPGIVKRF
ncbi:hypothetical protein T440DRAFT_469035 [Plenodomus tracheiphilus IPT5]|uniref:Secreted protein n=1 Tax=Plenodomus tracheiphilus IPT5 TaxID=1408161 RepID=A0A6A7B6U9_9PLEO|nr:hypothetical protein T440DRAFT_469035 [Plenodomus tracheiphilus IPT5]